MSTPEVTPVHDESIETATEASAATVDAGNEPTVAPTVLRRREAKLDLLEGETDYLLRVEVPGVTTEDVDLHVVEGELRLEARADDGDLFERRVRFPKAADLDGTEATLKHGLLELRVPKRRAAIPRKVPIVAA